MKKTFILALLLSFAMTIGTYFYDFRTLKPPVDVDPSSYQVVPFDTKGFPFSFIERADVSEVAFETSQTDAVQTNAARFIASWAVWLFIVFTGLLLIEWIAGVAGKLIVRTVVGIIIAAYGLLVILG